MTRRPTGIIPALLMLTALLFTPVLQAQEVTTGYKPKSRILFIFDASNSMAGQWDGARKIDIAREILEDMVDSLEQMSNVEMALRIYGHQSPVPPQDCNDTKLEVPFGPNNASRIRQKLRFINPKGTTPIAYSLELAPDDFPPCGNCRNIILLITDGVEACEGDPCAVSLRLQKKGIILRPFVIGIGTDPGFRETFNCIGEYYNAPNKKQFREALKVVIAQALNATSVQVNLLDTKQRPTETDVNVVFYDRFSDVIRYNMIHTINSKGNPDTLSLDHLSTYNVKVQTIPPVTIDSIRLVTGRHNTIGIDAPQGYLHVRTSRGKAYDNEKILVKKANDPRTINIQEMGNVGKYIVGAYDLEIPIYPLMMVEDVEILQSYTTTVEIPAPGYVTFTALQPGAGTLYQLTPEGDQVWVMNLQENRKTQGYYLQPGSYRVVFRRADLRSTSFSLVRDLEVDSGSSETVKFY
ncbi:MAG: VWA domain-containing protein [Bacteroidales bacterium]|nr:VWA domain-containing protein [Bacteroidales bacterium]